MAVGRPSDSEDWVKHCYTKWCPDPDSPVSSFWATIFLKEFSCWREECGPVAYLWSAWINVPPRWGHGPLSLLPLPTLALSHQNPLQSWSTELPSLQIVMGEILKVMPCLTSEKFLWWYQTCTTVTAQRNDTDIRICLIGFAERNNLLWGRKPLQLKEAKLCSKQTFTSVQGVVRENWW